MIWTFKDALVALILSLAFVCLSVEVGSWAIIGQSFWLNLSDIINTWELGVQLDTNLRLEVCHG